MLPGTRGGSFKTTPPGSRLAFSIVAFENPYLEARLRGRVAERRKDAEFKIMDRLSFSSRLRQNPAERVVLVIEVEHARFPCWSLMRGPA